MLHGRAARAGFLFAPLGAGIRPLQVLDVSHNGVGTAGIEAICGGACSGTPIRDTSCCCHPLTGVPYLRSRTVQVWWTSTAAASASST